MSEVPVLSVLKGAPSAEELAALTVVVAALSQRRPARRRPQPVGGWSARAGLLRRPLHAGPGGWRAAGGPA